MSSFLGGGSGSGSGSGTVTQVDTGTGLTGGPITTTGTVSLANTAVTPGSYTNTNLTVDAQGRLTAAASGSAGGTPGQMTGPVYNSNYNYLVPTTGATINLNNTDYQIILDPAADLGSLSLVMPPAPFDGQLMEISTANHRISGFALTPNAGQTVLDSPNALSDGSPVFAIYRAANTTWYVTYSVPFLPANGNITFFVATTGSDSNSGTAAFPFASVQHAINVASQYDWQNQFVPTISIAAGTYVVFGSGPSIDCLITGPFKNLSTNSLQVSGSGVANTFCGGGQIGIQDINIAIKDINFSVVTPGSAALLNPLVNAGCTVNGDLTFSAPSASFPFFCEGFNTGFFVGGHTLTYTNSTILGFFFAEGANHLGGITLFNSTVSLPAALAVTGQAFISVGQYTSRIQFQNVTWINKGGVTGPALVADEGASLFMPTPALTDIPGNAATSYVDNTVFLAYATFPGFFMNKLARIPLATDIPLDCYGIFKDTAGGGVYVACNDAGTLKKVALV